MRTYHKTIRWAGRTALPLLLLLTGSTLSAQLMDPVQWEFTAQRTGEGTYAVTATATIEEPWHIYSQYTDEGGPLPTSFEFKEGPGIQLKGKPREEGALIERYEAVFMVDTRYYASTVDFVQTVAVKGKAPVELEGAVRYMACTDEQCLVPTEVEFKVVLDQ